jgi:hypothetical protein
VAAELNGAIRLPLKIPRSSDTLADMEIPVGDRNSAASYVDYSAKGSSSESEELIGELSDEELKYLEENLDAKDML